MKKRKVVHDPITAGFIKRRQREVKDNMKFDIAKTLENEKTEIKKYLNSEIVEESCIPIINDMNKLKLVWDMFILLLAVLTSFAVGFELVISALT